MPRARAGRWASSYCPTPRCSGPLGAEAVQDAQDGGPCCRSCARTEGDVDLEGSSCFMEAQQVARPKTLIACEAGEAESLRPCREENRPDAGVLDDVDERPAGRQLGERSRWPAAAADRLIFSWEGEGGDRENLWRVGDGGQRP